MYTKYNKLWYAHIKSKLVAKPIDKILLLVRMKNEFTPVNFKKAKNDDRH